MPSKKKEAKLESSTQKRLKHSVPKILEERRSDWGDPKRTHERIALVWSGILGFEVTSYQVALCMMGMKLVRADLNPNNLDSLIDVEGYKSIAQLIQEDEELF